MSRLWMVMILFSAGAAQASVNLQVANGKYELTLFMKFKDIPLNQVVFGLMSPAVLTELSPAIVKIENIETEKMHYDSLMTLKNFGLKSKLLSHCKTSGNSQTWMRHCVLDTQAENGGDYMKDKSDQVDCTVKGEGVEVQCQFVIRGETKPLVFLSVPFMSASRLSLRTKTEALKNFVKQYEFIRSGGVSTRLALSNYEKSFLKVEIEKIVNDGDLALKNFENFKWHMEGME